MKKLNSILLKSQIVLHDKKISEVAEILNISKSAFYRKLKGKTEFTRQEIEILIKCLGLSIEMAMEIFFNEKVS